MDVSSTQPFGQTISGLAHGKKNTDEAGRVEADRVFGAVVSDMAHERNAARRASAVDSDVSITVGDDQNALTLLLKTSIEGVNTALESAVPEFTPIQTPSDTGIDPDPETTAEQIIALSTSAFGIYAEANADPDLAGQLTDFIALILGGIEEGFATASTTLEQAGALEDNTENIEATYKLVAQKLAVFEAALLASNTVEQPTIEEPAADVDTLVAEI